MEYVNLGGGDYLLKIEPDNVDRTIELIANQSYDSAQIRGHSVAKKDVLIDDFITFDKDFQRILDLKMGVVNNRQCYTRVQRMPMGNDFIFRGKYFTRSGRDPEKFLNDIVEEIEKNK